MQSFVMSKRAYEHPEHLAIQAAKWQACADFHNRSMVAVTLSELLYRLCYPNIGAPPLPSQQRPYIKLKSELL